MSRARVRRGAPLPARPSSGGRSGFLSGPGVEAVAAVHGEQQPGAGRVGLDLLAQAVDVRLQRVRGHALAVAPHPVQQSLAGHRLAGRAVKVLQDVALLLDRKSTRLNSSHANISYAVF